MIAVITFLCCHAASAPHFSEFAKVLHEKGTETEILATEEAYKAFKAGEAQKFELTDEGSVHTVAEKCALSEALLCDGGHLFGAKVFKELKTIAPQVKRILYYENPERFVPGGYSLAIEQAVKEADTVLFSSIHLLEGEIFSAPETPIDLSGKRVEAIGFSPLLLEPPVKSTRATFFKQQGIEEWGQKVLVYVGGANEVYYEKAFPHFLKLLEEVDLSEFTVVFQQHGRAAREGNRDGKLLAEWQKSHSQKVIVSKAKFDEILGVATHALYYQTTTNAKLLLAGILTIQCGHESFQDALVREGFCPSVVDATSLRQALHMTPRSVSREAIFNSLGIRSDWKERLLKAL